jgi:hypothetical protein
MEDVFISNFARNVFTVTYCDVDFSHQRLFSSEVHQNVRKQAAPLPDVFSDDGKLRRRH